MRGWVLDGYMLSAESRELRESAGSRVRGVIKVNTDDAAAESLSLEGSSWRTSHGTEDPTASRQHVAAEVDHFDTLVSSHGQRADGFGNHLT